MTQAPATPSLVERLRSYYPPICQEAADALEAQQARIAELEVERDDLQRMYRHWAMIADQRLGASNRSLHRARDLQALADRYEKALRPFAEVARHDIGEDEADADLFKPMSERYARAPLLKVGDLRRAAFSIDDAAAENGQDGEPDEVLVDVAASLAAAISLLERGGRKASPSDKMFEHMLSDYRGSLSRARQALSSQGRHEGVTSGSIPELPGVNAVPLPASPDELLSDPHFVHLNMLRGGVAKLTPAQIGHLYRGSEAAEVIAEVMRQNPAVQPTGALYGLVNAARRHMATHPVFRTRRIGGDGSRARLEQEDQIASEDALRAAIQAALSPSHTHTNPKAGAPEHG